MLIIAVLCFIGLSALRLACKEDRIAGLSFAALILTQVICLTSISDVYGFLYAGGGAVLALLLILAFSRFRHTVYIERLMAILSAKILLDYISLQVWNAGMSMDVINGCFLGLYAFTCWATLRGKTDEPDCYPSDSVFRVAAV